MIIPPETEWQTGTTLADTLDGVLERALAEIPLRVIPVVPQRDTFGESNPQARRLAELIGDLIIGDEIDATTGHAWLVVLGYFAQALGLVGGLEAVPLGQRKGPECGPQTKLIEFLVGILGGIEYLQDLNLSDDPIAKDPTVIEAWGQDAFVHYSGVSRTLDAADEETLRAVVDVLQTLSRPFIDAAVMETIRERGQLVVDVDLAGREVSSTSTDYPEADFGWMEDAVKKGYQAALTSLVCGRWRRLMLTLQRYPGRTLSADCLQAAVHAVEELLGVRPRRRVELIRQRREALSARMRALGEALDDTRKAEGVLWQRIREAGEEIKRRQTTPAILNMATWYTCGGGSVREKALRQRRRGRLGSD